MMARPFASETVAALAVWRLKCSVVAHVIAGPRRSPRPCSNRACSDAGGPADSRPICETSGRLAQPKDDSSNDEPEVVMSKVRAARSSEDGLGPCDRQSGKAIVSKS